MLFLRFQVSHKAGDGVFVGWGMGDWRETYPNGKACEQLRSYITVSRCWG